MNFLDGLSTSGGILQPMEVVVDLTLAFLLGMAVAVVYRMTNRQRAISRSFQLTMVILAMVVALVMMVIGNSIARAFSLVGALSIIRFRTVVKDNRDIAFIFFALAAGMAAGVGQVQLAVIGVGLILGFLLILDFVEFGKPRKGLFLLRYQLIPTDFDDQQFEPIFKNFLSMFNRISVKSTRMGQYVEHTWLVRLKRSTDEQGLITALSALEGMERVSLIEESAETEL